MSWGRRDDRAIPSVVAKRDSHSDERLLADIAGRDPDALAAAYARHGAAVYALARSLAPDAAEELVEAVFLRLWKSAGHLLDSPIPMPAWLAMTTQRCATRLGRPGHAVGSESWCAGAVAAVALVSADVPLTVIATWMGTEVGVLRSCLGKGLVALSQQGGLGGALGFAG